MPLHPEVQKFEQLLPTLFADLFGEKADHQCMYRELVFDFMVHELQHHTTESLAGPSVLLIKVNMIYNVNSSPSI